MNAKGSRIILIDDELKMTKLLKILLEDELDCDVETFNDPVAAYQRLQVQAFDLISLDYRMPKLNGIALLKLLKNVPSVNTPTPVIMFTAFLEEVESLRLDQLEHVFFLEKPVGDEQYLRNVKMALQMNRNLKKTA